MSIIGVGIDILAVPRIEAIVRRGRAYTARFSRRILSGRELDHFQAVVARLSEAEQTRYLAARWCLKEALYKAAYPHQVLRWGDVSIAKIGPKPAAEVAWAPALAHAHAHISLAHDRDLVIGYAVIEGQP
ncbi:hypothetical protein LPJ61_004250 [Coemansia biformis]|uniref:4'-phosphopantetheinyl transferase domain-containing protein n=1 Tax=Coemansia biformis TaxID=1286918 RepID=A0A9W7Y561_9FUNG|nr:hypothetical protein LPJ61_004250 [Coemansia biformis]